jgi:hypothetical protein
MSEPDDHRRRIKATTHDFAEAQKGNVARISFITIVPGFSGLEFVAGDKTLMLRDARHEYVFTGTFAPN